MECAMDRVPLEQKGVGLGICQIVDRDQFKAAIRPLKDGPRNVAPDAAETVNGNFRHGFNSF
jgi:hypothetical protein